MDEMKPTEWSLEWGCADCWELGGFGRALPLTTRTEMICIVCGRVKKCVLLSSEMIEAVKKKLPDR